jgi:Domain of unknown function (DUF1729)
MPFDGFLFASRVMVAKEAHTSSSAKDLIIAALGMGDTYWEGTYSKPTGGILTVCSELGEPTTRSGAEFSPWMFGPPIRTHKPFSIAAALKTAVRERMEREDAGYESENEHEVESPLLTPPPSSPASPTSPLTPLPLSPSLPYAFALPPVGPPSPSLQNLLLPMPLSSSGLLGTSFLPAGSASSFSCPPSTKPSGKEHDKNPVLATATRAIQKQAKMPGSHGNMMLEMCTPLASSRRLPGGKRAALGACPCCFPNYLNLFQRHSTKILLLSFESGMA